MQVTIDCNGPGLPDYPSEVKPKDVTVWVHDSLMVMTHDYSCPCCRAESAVLDGNTGLMQPCWGCQEKGYRIINKCVDRWWQRLWWRK